MTSLFDSKSTIKHNEGTRHRNTMKELPFNLRSRDFGRHQCHLCPAHLLKMCHMFEACEADDERIVEGCRYPINSHVWKEIPASCLFSSFFYKPSFFSVSTFNSRVSLLNVYVLFIDVYYYIVCIVFYIIYALNLDLLALPPQTIASLLFCPWFHGAEPMWRTHGMWK